MSVMEDTGVSVMEDTEVSVMEETGTTATEEVAEVVDLAAKDEVKSRDCWESQSVPKCHRKQLKFIQQGVVKIWAHKSNSVQSRLEHIRSLRGFRKQLYLLRMSVFRLFCSSLPEIELCFQPRQLPLQFWSLNYEI